MNGDKQGVVDDSRNLEGDLLNSWILGSGLAQANGGDNR